MGTALPLGRTGVNYRHGFHAGNHTEPFKHAILWTLLDMLKAKETPLAVLDTHAGAGLYDLRSDMALRTNEARDGIVRLISCRAPALAGYLATVRAVGGDAPTMYPGSPEIVRRALRLDDRLVACELRREDASMLRANMAGDPRVSVHCRDGYEAALALVPPMERRGLVFLDPPFEDAGETEKLGALLRRACAKWPGGIFVAWFPLKSSRAALAAQRAALDNDARRVIAATFLRQPYGGERLAGSLLAVLNPPWQAEVRAAAVCRALADGFAAGTWSVDVLRGE